MKQKTTIAAGIDITAKQAAYDAVCKRLISEKFVLAWLMHSCLDEYRNTDVSTIAEKYIADQPLVNLVPVEPDMTGSFLQNIGQEQISPTEGEVQFDIYFNAIVPSNNETVQLIINVEAQRDFYPGYSLTKRALYYCARMISAQKGSVFEHSDYGKLRKVYSIWLCLKPPQSFTNSITKFHIVKDIILGSNPEKLSNYDLLTIIMLYLNDADEPQGEGILKLLSVLLSSKLSADSKKQLLQDEFGIPMTQELNREVNNMFDLSQALVEESEARGEARGLKIGLEQASLIAIRNLMKTMKLTAQDAMQALCIPESEREKYLAKLAQ